MSIERLKISFFFPSFRGGGVERVMLNLAAGFADRGLNIDLVIVNAVGALQSQLPDKVRLVDLRAKRVLASLPKLACYLRKEKPSILLSAMAHANVVALWAKWLANPTTKVLVAEHNTLSQSVENSTGIKGRLMPFFIRLFYPLADGIIAVSRGVAEDLSRMAGLPRGSIKVLYNPVITPELLNKAAEPVDHPWFGAGCPPVLLGVGRLQKQKNFALLIRAFYLVRREMDAKLLILGEGKERTVLQNLITRMALDNDVCLAGFVSNPYSYMAKAALFVLSSNWEGLPTVLIEALGCRTDVVSTDCKSGPEEILGDFKDGRLVPVGDEKAMAKAILKMIRSKPDFNFFRQRVNDFSLDNCVQGYLDFFKSKLNDGTGMWPFTPMKFQN